MLISFIINLFDSVLKLIDFQIIIIIDGSIAFVMHHCPILNYIILVYYFFFSFLIVSLVFSHILSRAVPSSLSLSFFSLLNLSVHDPP
jgi:hypothetical protein